MSPAAFRLLTGVLFRRQQHQYWRVYRISLDWNSFIHRTKSIDILISVFSVVPHRMYNFAQSYLINPSKTNRTNEHCDVI